MKTLATLICVDLQEEFVLPGRPWADPQAPQVLEVCRAALTAARAARWRIAHAHLHRGGPMTDPRALSRPASGFRPEPDEVLLRRTGVSIFSHPETCEIAAEAAACQAPVVMVGFSAPMSLSASLFDAHDRGLPLSLLKGAAGGADIGAWRAQETRHFCEAIAARLGRLADAERIGLDGSRSARVLRLV